MTKQEKALQLLSHIIKHEGQLISPKALYKIFHWPSFPLP